MILARGVAGSVPPGLFAYSAYSYFGTAFGALSTSLNPRKPAARQ